MGDTKTNIPFVDEWIPQHEDILFTNSKNIIIANLNSYFHLSEDAGISINYFMVNPKKSYNSDDLRNHYCQYVNYFERFFDEDKEYYTNLAKIKYLLDVYTKEYKKENFIYDVRRYIIQPSLCAKIRAMVEYNYSLSLSYKSINNPQLQYTDEHAKTLLAMSIFMNLCIPLITHFAYSRRIQNIDDFILDVFDDILYYQEFANMDISSKLYQTAISNVNRNAKNNAVIWSKQDIRGKDVVTHSMQAVRNIILNIMPKYAFNQNMVSLNYTSIQKSNKFSVTDIAYEYNYIPLSSAPGDGEDSASDLD